jgi:D-sedoheptulose 7-phosphate isomerase
VTAIDVKETMATEAVVRRFDASIDTTTRFFGTNVDAISQTCRQMALRFERGGRLIVFGTGAASTDAQHVSVEFIHPVIVGKRALPAISLTGGFASMIGVLARGDDIALALYGDANSAELSEAVAAAEGKGLLTIAVGSSAVDNPAAHSYRVLTDDPLVAQEVSETFYHVLWELVHLFIDHLAASAEPEAMANAGDVLRV